MAQHHGRNTVPLTQPTVLGQGDATITATSVDTYRSRP